MAEASIPVDLFNPGQVFACLGFLEAANVLLGDAEGGFDWSDETAVRFALRAKGEENPFAVVLGFLARANVVSVAPSDSGNRTEQWEIPTEVLAVDAPFPFPDPASPATLPAVLQGPRVWGDTGLVRLVIDHWGDDEDKTRRDAVKFWGGSAGYPGARRALNALDLVRDRCRGAATDPFALSAEQSSSFRFDWRRDYIPIDAGFSLNANHATPIVAVGFPLVEVLAALGLANARPNKIHHLEYRYGVLGRCDADSASMTPVFDPCLVRAVLGCSDLPLVRRTFRMRLGWTGQKGQERCITMVTEETSR